MKKSAAIIVLIIFFGSFGLIVGFRDIQAQGNIITIRTDGSIDPESSPIIAGDPVGGRIPYTFTSDISNLELRIEMDYVSIDGAGYSLTSTTDLEVGVMLQDREGVRITNLRIEGYQYGIILQDCGTCRIDYSTITGNTICGIEFRGISSWCHIIENMILGNLGDGIGLRDQTRNTQINSNRIEENLGAGIDISDSSNDNTVHNNNFIDNNLQVGAYNGQFNRWNGDYSGDGGGNYWSDYSSRGYPLNDIASGMDQTESGSDGVWDHTYDVYPNDDIRDYYPLVEPWVRGKILTWISLTIKGVSGTILKAYHDEPVTFSGRITPPVAGVKVTIVFHSSVYLEFSKTTNSRGEYTLTHTFAMDAKYEVLAKWDGNDEYEGATSQIDYFEVVPKDSGAFLKCIIATATYGSELSPEVQFLREFRDDTVLSTFAGSNFMEAFNAFYYSWSPSVAPTISENIGLKDGMKVVLYPLMGILHLSSTSFSVFSIIPEMSIVIAGFVASSLIAVVYVVPWIFLLRFFKKFKVPIKSFFCIGIGWIISIVFITVAEVVKSSPIMTVSTGAFVLLTMALTTLSTVTWLPTIINEIYQIIKPHLVSMWLFSRRIANPFSKPL
ncbi:NosD domain-containing protein [Thermoproteota archaeon]